MPRRGWSPVGMSASHGRTASIRSGAPAAAALVLLAALSSLPARADATDDPASPAAEKPYWRTSLFGRFFTGQKYLFTTWWPSEFKRPAFTAPLLAGTALAISSSHDGGEGPDVQLERRFSEWTGDRNTTSAHLFTSLGNGATGAVLLGTT